MSRRLTGVFGATLLLLSLAAVAAGQTQTTTTVTKTEAIQNSDGTYTIVEYPVGKETVVTLNPVGLSGATGTATILRAADGTTIKVNLAKLPNEVTAVNLYAIDAEGKVTLLGPITVANNAGISTTSTPLTKFMLIASPDASLTAYNDSTQVLFRSAVPAGLTVIPITNAVGEQVAAVVAPATTAAAATVAPPVTATVPAVTATVPAVTATVPAVTAAVPTAESVVAAATDYTVPMLGIPTFKKGDDTKLKINFSGAMEGARANIFIEPHKNGKTTEVRMAFHDLKEAPKGTVYILWAISPDNQFAQLGQIVNVKGRNEAEIKSEVTFDDFGLLLTTEDLGATKGTIIKPSGQRVGVIQIVP
jgi:hypothetical protein